MHVYSYTSPAQHNIIAYYKSTLCVHSSSNHVLLCLMTSYHKNHIISIIFPEISE